MRYYCTRCEKDVEICSHRTSIELDHFKEKSRQHFELAKYWEEKYNNLKKKVKECIICREE